MSRISASAFLAALACATWWHPWLPSLVDRNEADDGRVSRVLASNTSDLQADVLLVLDFTVPPLHRRQQQEFAAALVGNVSANVDWHLFFGVVVFHELVKYELPLSDDYASLRAQLLDPSFGASFGSQSLRSTDGALQLCSDVIQERDTVQPFSRSNVLNVLVLLTAGVSKSVSGTLMTAAELKLEQGVTIYAIALDELDGRIPTRISELSGLATDSFKEFNAKFSPETTTSTTTTSTGVETVTPSPATTQSTTSSRRTSSTSLTATASTGTTFTTTSSTTNETNETNATTTTTTRTTTYASSNDTTQNTTTWATTTTTFSSTSLDDDRRLRQLFGNSTIIDIGDLGFVLGEALVNFLDELEADFNTSTTMGELEPPGIGNLDGGIVVLIVLSTCCFIAVMMGIAYYAWHTMRHSADVEDLDIRGTPVVPAPPAPPRPAAPPPRDATQKALKEAIDFQDLGKLRSMLSEILLKGWPEKKYADLVLKALEVVGTLKESAAETLQDALAENQLPQSALANARLAGVAPELLCRAEQLRHRTVAVAPASRSAGSLT